MGAARRQQSGPGTGRAQRGQAGRRRPGLPRARRRGAGAALRCLTAGRLPAARRADARALRPPRHPGQQRWHLRPRLARRGGRSVLVRAPVPRELLGQRLDHARRPAPSEGQPRPRGGGLQPGRPGRRARPHRLQQQQVRDERLLRGAAPGARPARRQRHRGLSGRGGHADPLPWLQCQGRGQGQQLAGREQCDAGAGMRAAHPRRHAGAQTRDRDDLQGQDRPLAQAAGPAMVDRMALAALHKEEKLQ